MKADTDARCRSLGLRWMRLGDRSRRNGQQSPAYRGFHRAVRLDTWATNPSNENILKGRWVAGKASVARKRWDARGEVRLQKWWVASMRRYEFGVSVMIDTNERFGLDFGFLFGLPR